MAGETPQPESGASDASAIPSQTGEFGASLAHNLQAFDSELPTSTPAAEMPDTPKDQVPTNEEPTEPKQAA